MMLLGPMVVEMMVILRIIVCADGVFHFFIFLL